jgi:hypothetical protein
MLINTKGLKVQVRVNAHHAKTLDTVGAISQIKMQPHHEFLKRCNFLFKSSGLIYTFYCSHIAFMAVTLPSWFIFDS